MRHRLKTIKGETCMFSFSGVLNDGLELLVMVPQDVYDELEELDDDNNDEEILRRVQGATKLIFDETAKVLLCATNFKSRIAGVSLLSGGPAIGIYLSYPEGATRIDSSSSNNVRWVKYSVTKNDVTKEYTLSEDDLLTIEFDWGDTIDDHIPTDYAKETSVSYNIQQVGNMQGYLQNTIAKEATLGTAPVGSDKTTIFAWLTSLYDYVVGQDPEEIPEGLGDRINLLLQFFELTQAFEAEDVTPQEAIDIQQEVLDDVWPDCPVGSGGSAAWAARRNWADDTEADVRYYNSTIGLQCSPIPVNGPVVYNGYRFYPDGTYESIE